MRRLVISGPQRQSEVAYLSSIISEQDVDTITRLLDLVEQSHFAVFEVAIGEISVRVERAPFGLGNRISVPSPAVGIYRAPEENSSLRPCGNGTSKAGTILGYIETLDQRADVTVGETSNVVEPLVSDGQFVEYGQPLFVITTATD